MATINPTFSVTLFDDQARAYFKINRTDDLNEAIEAFNTRHNNRGERPIMAWRENAMDVEFHGFKDERSALEFQETVYVAVATRTWDHEERIKDLEAELTRRRTFMEESGDECLYRLATAGVGEGSK